MSMLLGDDGYYYLEHGDGTPYFAGSDGSWHPVMRVQDTTGTFGHDKEHMSKFLDLMMKHNNSFCNKSGELIEFTRATVVTGLHNSSAFGDSNSHLGIQHFGIQLTNDHLFMNDGTTHMYHFRPEQPELSSFYAHAQTRKQVAKKQNILYSNRQGRGSKKDPPSGGGASTSSHSSKGSSSKGNPSKGAESKGSSSKGSSSRGSTSKTGSSKSQSNKIDQFSHLDDEVGGPPGSHDSKLDNVMLPARELRQSRNITNMPQMQCTDQARTDPGPVPLSPDLLHMMLGEVVGAIVGEGRAFG